LKRYLFIEFNGLVSISASLSSEAFFILFDIVPNPYFCALIQKIAITYITPFPVKATKAFHVPLMAPSLFS
jgi:hypothetical protein